MPITIYMDACCLSRLGDDQTQPRISKETEAIRAILIRVRRGLIRWVSSEALVQEVNQTRDLNRRRAAASLLELAFETVSSSETIASRALDLQTANYGAY